MIKVPATPAGIPAIRRLIGAGLNINVTLMFAQSVYEQVAEAYVEGLSALVKKGGEPGRVASVASFFVSRIDTLIDNLIDAGPKTRTDSRDGAALKRLRGKVAIANARLVYQCYKEIHRSEQWRVLATKGAQSQRLLWASTSTKNPAYRDVMYVEELIGPDTVDTIPPATLDAFRDHGRPRASLEEGLDEAAATMNTLACVGVSMKEVTDRLLNEGVKTFADSFDNLLATIDHKHRAELYA
jgi:transaldolase / glucose-6-phosphate isomerase